MQSAALPNHAAAAAAVVVAGASAAGALRRSFSVTTLRSLNRRQSYVIVLDFASLVLHWHKLRRGVEVKRTFSFQSCIKLEKNSRDQRCLAVQFAEAGNAVPVDDPHSASSSPPSALSTGAASVVASLGASASSSGAVWQKLVFFVSAEERDLFCNLVHAAIVSGEQAVRVYQQLQHSGPSEPSPAASATLSPALRSLVGVDFCAFLIAFCSAQTALDLTAIAAANTASTYAAASGHSSHPSQSSAASEASLSSAQQPQAVSTAVSAQSQPAKTGPTLKEMYGIELLEGEVVVVQSTHTTRRDAGAGLVDSRGGWAGWEGRRAAASIRPGSAGPVRPASPSSAGALSSSSSRGNLFVTNFRLLYVPYRSSGSAALPFFVPASGSECEVTVGSLARVIRPSPGLSSLVLLTKDYRRLEFAFDASVEWVEGLQQQIAQMAFHHGHKTRKAFVWEHGAAMKRKREDLRAADDASGQGREEDAEVDGWALYSPVAEYARLGLLSSPHFRLTDCNSSFALCSSYPPSFVVPAPIADADLFTVAAYRSQGRVPAVMYVHPLTGACLSRAAQPLSGVRGRRCEMDEALLALLRKSTPHAPAPFHIIDLRPYKAAMGNAMMGKGFEPVQHYAHTTLTFSNVDNIHAMRHSMEKLAALCLGGGGADDAALAVDGAAAAAAVAGVEDATSSADDLQWLLKLDASAWLHYLRLLLSAAVKVALLLSVSGCSVLARCSDGWDRTSQLTSLVLLMLDPYHRTLEGFAVLVEKEWLSFGHHFGRRHGHGREDWNDSQRAPIFLQWLDAVYQVLRQAPHKFEFTEDFLVDLYDHMIGGRFGTFMEDSQREREELQLKQLTESVWTVMLHSAQRRRYTNPSYAPLSTAAAPSSPMSPPRPVDLIDALVSASSANGAATAAPPDYCIPNTSAKRLVLFERFHLRWDRSFVRSLSAQTTAAWSAEAQHAQHGERKERRRLERKYHTMRSRLEQAGVDVQALEDDDDEVVLVQEQQQQPEELVQRSQSGSTNGQRPSTAGAPSSTAWMRKSKGQGSFATLSAQQVAQLNGGASKARASLQVNTFTPPTPTGAQSAPPSASSTKEVHPAAAS